MVSHRKHKGIKTQHEHIKCLSRWHDFFGLVGIKENIRVYHIPVLDEITIQMVGLVIPSKAVNDVSQLTHIIIIILVFNGVIH